ncbi:MAG: carbohydrate ABC transporter substrate-binding protein [Synergistaceae bacterium]|nr:carbohydrate ABC transporter substrate-binding protein [Synergistaceae bacterium]MBR0249817.1 carbohydrate ABC transporter substrate-binding protein [Synergistaceae bacterium]
MKRLMLVPALVLCLCMSAFAAPVEIELVQYKQEALRTFDALAKKFNETHKNIHLTISSPNEPMTILKTRFIRENYPDIIGIGGDMDYSNFQDAELLADLTGYKGLEKIKKAYIDIIDGLKFVPEPGVFGVPYMANAAGVLYNKDIFDAHGWKIPESWPEFMKLCDDIQAAGIRPMFFGFKDTWTTLAPWNALAVDIAPADVCQNVNLGKTTFTKEYHEVAEKIYAMLKYAEEGPFAYGYNDACTAFARGESAMFVIGNYAIPQILSVNPKLNIDSFVMPGRNDSNHTLNSGVDIMFCVMDSCPHKEAAYEVLDFLLEPENIQAYVDEQNSVPCQTGEFRLTPMLNGMKKYIDAGRMSDYHDHHYPSEMAVDAQIQTYLIHGDINAFLARFDKDWIRYNRDIISKLKNYMAAH